jgi:hypothetical protein
MEVQFTPDQQTKLFRMAAADNGEFVEHRKMAQRFLRDEGWKLKIVKRRDRAFKITG